MSEASASPVSEHESDLQSSAVSENPEDAPRCTAHKSTDAPVMDEFERIMAQVLTDERVNVVRQAPRARSATVEMDSSVASDDDYQQEDDGSDQGSQVLANPIGARTRARVQPQPATQRRDQEQPRARFTSAPAANSSRSNLLPLPPVLPASIREAARFDAPQVSNLSNGGYDTSSPFLQFDTQTTDVLGYHQRAPDVRRIIERNLLEDAHEAFGDNANAVRADNDAPRAFVRGRMGEEEQDFCQQMMLDIANDQVTFVPDQLPEHKLENQRRVERLRKYGIFDIAKAVQDCKVCGTELTARYRDNLSAAKIEFLELTLPGMPGLVARCEQAADVYNMKIAGPTQKIHGPNSMPFITPGEVEVHMCYCKDWSLVIMDELIKSMIDVHRTIKKGGLYVNKRIAGTRTNEYSVSASGWRVLKEVSKELRETVKVRDILEYQQCNLNLVESAFARASGEKPKGGHGLGGRTRIVGMNGVVGLDARGQQKRR